jgi:hypothetical protein
MAVDIYLRQTFEGQDVDQLTDSDFSTDNAGFRYADDQFTAWRRCFGI